ncbi:glucose-1-phosphate adenylyltransferase family protein [Miniimonas sp. S16]|uniref:glucose-1-phosphate adenylyltransferase family protein n=1 Tax=Miniimonas sp. S16 TaxID=2171623 RepID=UPI000D528411|nr:sugar phosphate nucleotidyltransferase [Miniimonas sp. S16]
MKPQRRILCVILAGGKGSRLGVLTDHRVKPSLRVAGSYRLIDVALSNVANSGLSDVWIVEQYLPHSLNQHLSGGRPWDLDRIHGGLHLLAPFTGATGEGFAEGNSDSLWRHRERIAGFEPDLVVVLSADHLYALDVRDVVATHERHGAALTMVTTRTDADPSDHGVVVTDDEGVVTEFAYKPDEPADDLVAVEVFCFDGPALLEALDLLHERLGGLGDYGEDLVPYFVAQHRTVEHRLEGYWRDMGTPESYWIAHQQFLDGTGARLDDPAWPVRSAQPQLLPARVLAGAQVADSLLAPGSHVAGTVRRSVVGPGVVVEAGAVVEESVLLDGVHVASGVTLRRCLVDDGARLAQPGVVGEADAVTVIGPDGQVDASVAGDPSAD